MTLAWDDLLTALGLVLVLEGIVLSLFPNALRHAMALAMKLPNFSLRWVGLIALIVGFVVIWLVRG